MQHYNFSGKRPNRNMLFVCVVIEMTVSQQQA